MIPFGSLTEKDQRLEQSGYQGRRMRLRARRKLCKLLLQTRSKSLHHSPLNRRHQHHPGKRRNRSLSHWSTARFLGLFPFPSSVSSRVVSRLWSVLAVGEHGPFRRTVE